jgi:N-acyl-D-amino-acid deacylase
MKQGTWRGFRHSPEEWKNHRRKVQPLWESIPEYLETLARQPKTVNIAPLIGHGTLRAAIVGHEDRPPTPVDAFLQ